MKRTTYKHAGLLTSILLIGTSAAWAQNGQTSSSETSSSASNSSASEYVRDTCTTYDEWQKAFTDARFPSGQVMLDCAVAPDGHLTSCKVLSEPASDNGAGKAVASSFLCYAHVDTRATYGGLANGARKKFIFKW